MLRLIAPLRSIPMYMWLHLIGVALMLMWTQVVRPHTSGITVSDEHLPVYLFWGVMTALGAVHALGGNLWQRLRQTTWEDLGILILVLWAGAWVFHPTLMIQGMHLWLGYALLTVVRSRRWYGISVLSWASWLLVALGYLGILWASDRAVGWLQAEIALPLLQVGLVLPLVRLSRSGSERLMRALFFLGFAVLALQIYYYIDLEHYYDGARGILRCFTFDKLYIYDDAPHHYLTPYTRVIHPSYLMLMLAYPLWHTYRLRLESRGASLVYWLGMLLVCFILQPRYGFAICAGLALYPLARRVLPSLRRLHWAYWVGLGIVALGAVLGLIARVNFLHDGLRVAVYRNAVETIVAHLPLGLGTGADSLVHMERFAHLHSHNSWLSEGVDHGLLGLVALSLWVVALGYEALRRRSMFVGAYLILLLPLMMIESPLYMTYTIRFVVVHLLICYICSRQVASADRGRTTLL